MRILQILRQKWGDSMSWVRMPGGVEVPSPKFGSGGFTLSTFVDGGRNQNANFIGQVIGDDKLKYDITFATLSPEELRRFLSLFDRRVGGKFTNNFEVYDPVLGRFRSALMYVGDRSGQPFKLDDSDIPERFLDVKANLVEV